MDPLRTLVTFCSTRFNTSEPRDHFINSDCFGDDLAAWLIAELGRRGYRTDTAPGQEDFGWYFSFEAEGVPHTFVILWRPEEEGEGTWIGVVERATGFLASLLGRRKRGIQPAALQAIHQVLSEAPEIRDVRWHLESEFNRGQEEGAPAPF